MNAGIRLKQSARLGLIAGIKTWWWIVKITLIVTLFVVVLDWSGALAYLSEWLTPLFAHLGLSANGVFIFLTTAVGNIYAGIGVMATLAVDFREATILGIMGLLCHNLIVETIIQKKSGASATAMVILRIASALGVAFALHTILPADYNGKLVLEKITVQSGGFWDMIQGWAMSMARMVPIMFAIITTLNVLQQVLREFSVLKVMCIPFMPLMAIFGLKRSSALVWLILNTLGLAYGGSLMIVEREQNQLQKSEAKLLNTHIAMSHSMFEDTMLYVALGLPLFWMVVPRLVLAIIFVWIQRGWMALRLKRAKARANKARQL